MSAPTGNTIFLRLEGPMQSWGIGSRFVIRDTAREPSKSGVLGLICCAMGVRRVDARPVLEKLNALRMGVRVDRPGTVWGDFQTVGAGYGNLTAEGKIKRTQSTGEYEAVLSRRFYLCDASFLVALMGDRDTIGHAAQALAQPRWMLYLGRKSCPPATPIHDSRDGIASFADVESALASRPWRPRLKHLDDPPREGLRAVIECRSEGGARLPEEAELRMDEAVSFLPPVYRPRYVVRGTVAPQAIGDPTQRPIPRRTWPHAKYASSQWKDASAARVAKDEGLCVFCKRAARQVHHTTYLRAGREDLADLRSLCALCHDAVTMLEYGRNLGMERIDPCDPRHRGAIIAKRGEILQWRSLSQRRRRLAGEE